MNRLQWFYRPPVVGASSSAAGLGGKHGLDALLVSLRARAEDTIKLHGVEPLVIFRLWQHTEHFRKLSSCLTSLKKSIRNSFNRS